VDLTNLEPSSWPTRSLQNLLSGVASRLRTAFGKWEAAGQDPERYRMGVVRFRAKNGVTTTDLVW
jgi:hypothetical protein